MESNELIKRKSLETGVKEETLISYWKEAENEVMASAKTSIEKDKSKRPFWEQVKKKFLEKVDNLNIEEARIIMDSREKYKKASEQFLNSLQSDNYVAAKEVFPEVIETKCNIIINNMKDGYLKNMAAKRNKG